jgi:pheromone alpha factor receptor
MPDGVTPVVVSIKDLDDWNWYANASCINYGAQLGACMIMFFVVAALTKEHKRRTAIFILNMLSLLFGFLRALLFALYFVSAWNMIVPRYITNYAGVSAAAHATSVPGSVVPLLMTVAVDLSLVFQAHTVCHNMDNIPRYIAIGLSCVVFLLAVGFRFAVTVTNCIAIMDSTAYYSKEWITTGALATETITIWFFSLIFTGKLLYTLYNRHRMGWKQWSGVRILAAMGGCTMVIPCKYFISIPMSRTNAL